MTEMNYMIKIENLEVMGVQGKLEVVDGGIRPIFQPIGGIGGGDFKGKES